MGIPASVPPREFLAALNMACCWMGGTRDQFQSFCAGLATGISVSLECLDIDRDYYHPDVLGDDYRKKILSGAISVIEEFNASMEKDAIYEETNSGETRRDRFRKEALALYSEFVSQTRRFN